MKKNLLVPALIWATSVAVSLSLFAQPHAVSKTSSSAKSKAASHPEMDAFNAWASRFTTDKSAGRSSQAVTEGLALAKQRRAAMSKLMKVDPKQALELAFDSNSKSDLPAEIAAHIETKVSGIGDLSVRFYLAQKAGPKVQPVRRQVSIGGSTYQAFVYGRRATQTSKKGIPLHGIVLDGMIALDDSAIRILSAEEKSANRNSIVDLSGGNGSSSVLGEVNGKTYRFASLEQVREMETRIQTAEMSQAPTPSRSATSILEETTVAKSAGTPPEAPSSAWTTGLKKVLIIRVDFSDLPGEPVGWNDSSPLSNNTTTYTASYIQTIADTRLAPFYLKSSYGLTSLTNTVTTKVYRMPQTASFYATGGLDDQLHNDASAAAGADYTVASYDRVVVLFSYLGNIPGSFINYGGLAEAPGTRVWMNGEFDFRVSTHELGHTYGLMHAGLWQVSDNNPISPSGFTIEYGDDFDTMGANFANDGNTDFNPFYKNLLGWITDSQVQTVTTNGVYRLYAFDWANAAEAPTDSTLALKCVLDSERTYWVGARRNFTGNPTMQTGAYVMWGFNSIGAGGGGGFQSALLDLNTPGTGPFPFASDFDAALNLDQTFSDPLAQLMITPTANGGTLPNGYLDIQVGPSGPNLTVSTNYILGGNQNGKIDFNECNEVSVVLTNGGGATATGVQVSISSATPEVILVQSSSQFPDIIAAGTATNVTSFKLSTSPLFVCGTPVLLNLSIKSDQRTWSNQIALASGDLGPVLRFDSTNSVPIPDNSLAGISSPIVVSNVPQAIGKVAVSLYVAHTFDSDLTLQLISPDGTTINLARRHGGSGDNFGASCSDDAIRTTFDDDALTSIDAGSPPYLGSFRPMEPLAPLIGKSGSGVNGTWQLKVVDDVAIDVGILQCWSLNLYPTVCSDGGGECPGSDLAVGLTSTPEPTTLGSNLTYTISVTNFGPSTAKSVTLNQQVPGSFIFVSAIASQGGCAFANGTVTCNLGTIPANGKVTITVTVTPSSTGTFMSTATVGSNEPDFVSSNNSASVLSHVVVPAADLAVSLSATPSPALVGSTLTYTVQVTNKGPSTASGVFVTNILPNTVVFQSANTTQGFITNNAGTVVVSLGSLTNGARATINIFVTPTLIGGLTASSRVVGNQLDPIQGNNSASVTTLVSPAADLVLSLSGTPNPSVVGSNITYTISVTNKGPNTANNVLISDTLASTMTGIVPSSTKGTCSVSGNSVSCAVGSLAVGESVAVTIVAASTVIGSTPNSAAVASSEADPTPSNNIASISTLVAQPFVSVTAAGSRLLTESFAPANGAIESNENVTVEFFLKNAGNVPTTNVVATLLATGGVSAPSSAQSFGVMPAGGFPVSRNFSFTAAATNGGTITASLLLQDVGTVTNNLGTVTFTFRVSNELRFSNTNRINIPDSGSASLYPSVINVSGVTGLVGKVSVTLSNFAHTYPHDVAALLVGPNNQKVVLMAEAGAGAGVTNLNLTFDDTAALTLPEFGQLSSGVFVPTSYGNSPLMPAPAPAAPYATNLASFGGISPNGAWSLFIADSSAGDSGAIVQGWSLAVQTIIPVNQLADLKVSAVSFTNQLSVLDGNVHIFTISNLGPNTATSVLFTNVLSGPQAVVSIGSSQGTIFTNVNGSVVANLGSISAGGFATITNAVVATGAGSATSFASVVATELDLNAANNSLSIVTPIGIPAADIAMVGSLTPSAAITGRPVTYSFVVTNNGPKVGLNVILNGALVPGLINVSIISSQGSGSYSNGVLSFNLGNLSAGASASVALVGTRTAPVVFTNVVTVATGSSDSNPGNNTVSLPLVVTSPVPQIISAGLKLVSESINPATGAIEAGETVTLSIALTNTGSANTTNLNAVLQPGVGISVINGSQSYGVVATNGAAVTRSFSFSVAPSHTGPVSFTLQLTDASDLGSIPFSFALPQTVSFTNSGQIIIPDNGPASPYPSAITVNGLTGTVSKLVVDLKGFGHSFPSDVDVLLVGPNGRATILMAGAGGGHPVTNASLTFDDAASGALSPAAQIQSGTYRPSNSGSAANFSAPAPSGVNASSLAALNGISANGDWSLYVFDHSRGDAGSIVNGWSLAVTTIDPINASTDVQLKLSASTNLVFVGNSLVLSFAVTNNGPIAASNLAVTNLLPMGFNLISSNATQGTVSVSSGQVVWSLGALNAGSQATMSLTVVPSAAGNFFDSAVLNGSEVDLNPGNNSQFAGIVVAIPVPASFSGVVVSNLHAQFTLTGQPGQVYVVETSTNMINWLPLDSYTVPAGGTLKVVDPGIADSSRFYRAYIQP